MDSCEFYDRYDKDMETAIIECCTICKPQFTPKISIESGPECNHKKNCMFQKFTEKLNIAFPGPVTNCKICGVEFLKRIPGKYIAEHHVQGDKALLLLSLANIKIVSAPKSVKTTYCCNFCNAHFLENKVLDHLEECQSEGMILLNQLSNRIRSNFSKILNEDSCNVCSEKFHPSMLVSHVADRHPETLSLFRQFKDYVIEPCANSLLQCCTCNEVVLKENSKDHIKQYHPEHRSLLKELSTKSKIAIDQNVPGIVVPKKIIIKKQIAFEKHSETKNNKSFTLNQSSKIGKKGPIMIKKNILSQNTQRVASKKYLHFIKKRALFKKKSIKRNAFFIKNQRKGKSKSVENELPITFVKLERIPSHIYQECINQGYFKIPNDSGSSIESIVTPQSNIQPNASGNLFSTSLPTPPVGNILYGNEITEEKVQKAKKEGNAEVVIEECEGNGHKVEIGEDEIIEKRQWNAEIEEVNEDEISEKEKWQQKSEKDKVIKKMLIKYHEKEMKKQVLYWQKALTKYVIQHKDTLVQFERNLMNARKYIKNQQHGKKFIKSLNVIADVKIKKSVVYILQKLLDAMKKNVPLKKSHLYNALQGLEGLGQ